MFQMCLCISPICQMFITFGTSCEPRNLLKYYFSLICFTLIPAERCENYSSQGSQVIEFFSNQLKPLLKNLCAKLIHRQRSQFCISLTPKQTCVSATPSLSPGAPPHPRLSAALCSGEARALLAVSISSADPLIFLMLI